jgi:hypothetical protein
MILAVDWTVIAASMVTGITAMVVGFFGFLGTRYASSASLRQAEIELRRREDDRRDESRERRAEA